MATNTLPPQQKKGNFLSGSISRRASSSSISLSASPKLSPQGIGYSPTNVPAGSGISKTLRSLLPFSGNTKNATTSTSTPTKGPFSGFGTVRKSMARERERQASLSTDATPVVSIGHLQVEEQVPFRRSVSLSRLEKPLPMHPDALFSGEVHMQASERDLGYVLRSPSPVPPLSAELSTIIEADSSGVSKNIPVLLESVSTNQQSPPPAIQRDLLFVEPRVDRLRSGEQSPQVELDPDSSALDLPTDELAEEVREALRKSGSSGGSGKNWFSTDVVIDERRNTHFASSTLNMATVDPDLLALLSPNTATGKDSSPAELDPIDHVSFSPSRATRIRQASSFLPRLRSSNSPSPSPTTPHFSIPHSSPTKASPSTPRANTFNPRIPPSPTLPPPSPSSPRLASSITSTPPRSGLTHASARGTDATSISVALSTPIARRPRTNIFTHLTRASSDVKTPSSTSRLGPRALRQAIHGMTSSDRPHTPNRPLEDANGIQFGRGSLDSRRPQQAGSAAREIGLGRPSLDTPRLNTAAWRVRQRTRSSTSPERAMDLDSSPSPEVPFQGESRHRPSFDSARPSLDTSSRPGSVARMRERERERDQRPPSLRVIDASNDRISPGESDFRTRKRSLSVQEKLHTAAARTQLGSASEYGAGPSRPGSSLSGYGHGARRALGYDPDDPGSVSGGPGPKMEWLGPRTTRAFRDAGLLDFERSRDSPASKSGDGSDSTERILSLRRDRSGSMAASSPLVGQIHGLGGHTTRRSASEYNPAHGRPSSRMGYSEVGGVASTSSARRSSGSFSLYGAGNSAYGQGHQGLLDSPTFTLSSSSRERDTPKSSTSTAPTSVSESFGYPSRERERDKEEVREMKEKHATEMAALLSALSDSQRTVRMLREENGQLRDRFDHFTGVVRENENLRQACAELENACMALRGECTELHHELAAMKNRRALPKLAPSWSEGSARSGSRTPNGKFGQNSPLSMYSTPQFSTQRSREDEDDGLPDSKEDTVYDNTMIIHDDSIDGDDNQDEEDTRTPRYDSEPMTHNTHDPARGLAASHKSTSSLTPTHIRRLSNSSSIFPTVPSNMTMLLHDDGTALADMNRTSADNSQFHFSFPASPAPPIARSAIASPSPSTQATMPTSQPKSHTPSLPPVAFRDFAGPSHRSNKSINSTSSISPTTANFSIMSSSPKSLFLRPEHELLLGDMESLDLGIRGTDNVESSQQARADDDAW
ncbi:hypothetical protein D9619_009396 [Psilocybe cf. subviscida]|uniref:Uncharacterized protein n=1 Tax=Psilocybe cf. subviscida TaxID=2480587 RepID=A0A8H5BU06_9AGAR|nr:hypothetical protein D9619_009396 [Psilocybe cf. subviscida]